MDNDGEDESEGGKEEVSMVGDMAPSGDVSDPHRHVAPSGGASDPHEVSSHQLLKRIDASFMSPKLRVFLEFVCRL